MAQYRIITSRKAREDDMSKSNIYPLRRIVERPDYLLETLECGHTIVRPLGLGEFAMRPSKVKSRRCYKCSPLSRPRGE